MLPFRLVRLELDLSVRQPSLQVRALAGRQRHVAVLVVLAGTNHDAVLIKLDVAITRKSSVSNLDLEDQYFYQFMIIIINLF